MPLGDVSYQNAALAAVVGSWPSSGATYRLYSGDPSAAALPSDVELVTGGGYSPQTFSPSDWATPTSGATSATVSFGTSTDAYSDDATYWGIVDGAGLLVFSDDLDGQQITVDVADVDVSFTPTLAFGDA